MSDLCDTLWPWVEQYQDLLIHNASDGKYMHMLRTLVLEHRRRSIMDMFHCSDAGKLVDLNDKQMSRKIAQVLREVFTPRQPSRAWSKWRRLSAGCFLLFLLSSPCWAFWVGTR